MAFYSELADADKVTGTAIVTSGIWQDGVSNITTGGVLKVDTNTSSVPSSSVSGVNAAGESS